MKKWKRGDKIYAKINGEVIPAKIIKHMLWGVYRVKFFKNGKIWKAFSYKTDISRRSTDYLVDSLL